MGTGVTNEWSYTSTPLYAVLARSGAAFLSTFSPSASNLFDEVITREESPVTVTAASKHTVQKGVDIARGNGPTVRATEHNRLQG
jgi:hypothetical protein